MYKTSLIIDDNTPGNTKKDIEISIVSGFTDGDHTHVYHVFDLANPIANMGLIGVSNNQNFAIKFRCNSDARIGFSIYLDGINIWQKTGIHSINQLSEHLRHQYKLHNGIFIYNTDKKGTNRYLDRYNQINDTNRLFKFTTEDNKGINEILISDPTLTNRIEIYAWKEVIIKEQYDDMFSIDFAPEVIDEKDTKIGAGDATHKQFRSVSTLENPSYLGKVTFVHVNASKISHLGKTLLEKKDLEKTVFDDPMNKVPK